MIFKKKEEKLETYSLDQCTNCGKSRKRQFKIGDYVFKTIQTCNACNSGKIMISKIFGEVMK